MPEYHDASSESSNPTIDSPSAAHSITVALPATVPDDLMTSDEGNVVPEEEPLDKMLEQYGFEFNRYMGKISTRIRIVVARARTSATGSFAGVEDELQGEEEGEDEEEEEAEICSELKRCGMVFKESMTKFASDVRKRGMKLNLVTTDNEELTQYIRELESDNKSYQRQIHDLLGERTFGEAHAERVAKLTEETMEKSERVFKNYKEVHARGLEYKARLEELEEQHKKDLDEIVKLRAQVLELGGSL